MTVNGEEIHADEYASYMMSQIINYQQMYAMYGLSEKNMASTFGDATMEEVMQYNQMFYKSMMIKKERKPSENKDDMSR